MIDQEQRLVIPWMVVPPQEGTPVHKLLVSAPGGQIIELVVSPKTAEMLDDFLVDPSLWQTFFTSLINSIEMQNA